MVYSLIAEKGLPASTVTEKWTFLLHLVEPRVEVNSHMEVGLEVLTGRAHLGPDIRSMAALLELNFIPLRGERYDLLITKDRFFHRGIQNFIGLLQETEFKDMATTITGYDTSASDKIVYPNEADA